MLVLSLSRLIISVGDLWSYNRACPKTTRSFLVMIFQSPTAVSFGGVFIQLFLGGRMNKIISLVFVFLCLVSADVMAIVGGDDTGTTTSCEGKSDMVSCNSTTDGYSCYWGYLREFTGGPMSDMCYECTNLPVTDYIKVSDETDVQPTITLHTAKTVQLYNGQYYQYANESGFCPIAVTCPSGYGLKLYRKSSCSTLSSNSDCNLYIACHKCGMGTFDRETKLLRLYSTNTNSYDLYYVKNFWTDEYMNRTEVAEKMSLDSQYGCGSCGDNATVNTAGNNCDCNDGYAYYDAAGRAKFKNVDSHNCEKRVYRVYLNTGTEASTSSPYIRYRVGDGYDLDKDTSFGDDGTSLDSIVNISEPKKNFTGWYFCPRYSDMDTECGAAVFTTNAVDNSVNIVDLCDKQISCQINEYDALNLYKKYSWKKYTVAYSDGEEKQCTYNSDCVVKTVPLNVPDGQVFSHWALDGNQVDGGGNIKSIETAMTSEFVDGTAVLSAQFVDCPAGFYCTGGEENPCPVGTTSDAGADEKTDCYISSATKFQDGSGRTFTLPIGRVYVK